MPANHNNPMWSDRIIVQLHLFHSSSHDLLVLIFIPSTITEPPIYLICWWMHSYQFSPQLEIIYRPSFISRRRFCCLLLNEACSPESYWSGTLWLYSYPEQNSSPSLLTMSIIINIYIFVPANKFKVYSTLMRVSSSKV